MDKKIITENGNNIAVIYNSEPLITDTQSALDLIVSLYYNDGCSRIVLNRETLAENFFILSSGMAGEVLQKFSNYHAKIAIVGDFSQYTSKSLKDFMYECNNGNTAFFVENEEAAVDRLSKV